MKHKKVLFSVIPFDRGGAGAHLSYLQKEKQYDVILVPKSIFKNKIINKISIILQIIVLVLYGTYVLISNNVTSTITHPQTLRYFLTALIIRYSQKVNYYVLDCHFFCIKSYNYKFGQNCTSCLSDKRHSQDCIPYPVKHSRYSYYYFIKTVKANSSKVKFFCQTNGYVKLLRTVFGDEIDVKVEKMKTLELLSLLNEVRLPKKQKYKFDFIFHASFISAKGADYCLELASKMPKHIFVVPENTLIDNNVPKNVIFRPCTWQTGLKQLIIDSRIVLCLSRWSAPTEAAVLKSMLLGKPTVMMNENTFSHDIPSGAYISLSGNSDVDSKELSMVLDDQNLIDNLSYRAYCFAKSFLN